MFFLLLSMNKSENFLIDLKNPAKIFAFSWPICLMPIEKMNLSNSIIFDFSIASLRLFIDNFPQPSICSISSYLRLKISCGNLINFKYQKFSTIFFPKPSILNVSFYTKCLIFSIEIFSHSYTSLTHLLTASCFLVNSL